MVRSDSRQRVVLVFAYDGTSHIPVAALTTTTKAKKEKTTSAAL